MDASGGWMADAACKDADPDLFTTNEEARDPHPAAAIICYTCPVKVECEAFARRLGLWGTWGGTSHWQRQQLKRRYRRAMCPVCRVVAPLIEMGDAQACVACAQSWRATPVPLRGRA